MRIDYIEFKNFASYGNQIQKIEFDKKVTELFLTLGKNGEGKCLSKDTRLVVEIEDEEIKKQFLLFLSKKSIGS
jgi:hypothetical protein